MRAQLDEILALYRELTEEEQEGLDISRCLALQEALDAANKPSVAETETVAYRNAVWDDEKKEVVYTDKTAESCTLVAASADAVTWSEGWYVVKGSVTIDKLVTVSGDVQLILSNDCALEVKDGICVKDGNSLTIYAQSEQDTMGSLKATASTSGQAGIGGGSEKAGGTITINGGKVTAKGTTGGSYYASAGIGGGYKGSGGTITVNGGAVTATGGGVNYGGAGIGSGSGSGGVSKGTAITINGGTVTANGGGISDGGAGIGGGANSAGGTITINGGRVTAKGSGNYGSAGIGGGVNSAGGTIKITGGTVTATGGGSVISGGAGIGGGEGGGGGTITITGGTVEAVGGKGGAGIGGGNSGGAGTIFTGGGTVNGKAYYTVSFVLQDEDVPVQGIVEGGKAAKPSLPDLELEGYTVDWYKDKGFTEWFDFASDTINGPLTLYGQKKESTDYIVEVTTGGETKGYAIIAKAWEAVAGQTGTIGIKVLKDATTNETLTVGSGMDVTVEMAEGVTLRNVAEDCFKVDGGTLTLKDGTVVETASGKSVVYAASGELCITGGNYRSDGNDGNGLWVDAAATVRLSGGTISASNVAMRYASRKLKEMLDTQEDQCTAFYDAAGNPATDILSASESKKGASYTVKQSAEHDYKWRDGGTQHYRCCTNCGKEKDWDDHNFDGSVCTVCQAKAAAVVATEDGSVSGYASLAEAWAAVQGQTATMTILKGQSLTDDGIMRIRDAGTNVTVEMADGVRLNSDSDIFIVYTGKLTLNSGTYVSSGAGKSGIYMTGGDVTVNGGTIEMTGSSSDSDKTKAIRINGGTLHLCGGELKVTGLNGIALLVNKGEVTLTGGTLTSTQNKALLIDGDNYDSIQDLLLGEELQIFKDGEPLTDGLLGGKELGTGTYTVTKCIHRYHYTHTEGTMVHERICDFCGDTEAEPCQYDWSDGSSKGVCDVCKSSFLTVLVDGTERLVYDGTEKKPSVDVMIDDKNRLAEDGYTVTYSNNINAGDDTASVTVEGKAFTGTYTQKFSIAKVTGILTVPQTTVEKTFGDAAFSLNCSTNVDGEISYTSDNEDVALVSADGTVQVKGAGEAQITVSLAEGENYTGVSGETVTVKVAKKGKYPVDEINRRYLYTREHTGEIDLAAFLPKDCGTVTYKTPATSGKVDFPAAGVDENGVLFYMVANGNAGDSGAITVTVETQNYEDMTIVVNVELTDRMTVSEKEGWKVTLKNDTLTYGETLSKLVFNSAVFVDDNNGEVDGSLEWKNPSEMPDAGTVSAAWVFTPFDDQYEKLEGNISITVNKAVPAVTAPSVADRVYNPAVSLADSDLSGGLAKGVDGKELKGAWRWKQAGIVPTVDNDGYAAVFTPENAANYETAEAMVKLTVNKAQSAPDMPESAMDVPENIVKVGDIALPEGWAWQEADRDTTLTAGTTVSAVAVYTGADRGNYEKETVTISITVGKSSCDHTAGDDILYTGAGEKAPTCTEAGLGHRECTKCGAVVESGITVPPLGHDYTSEVTKEPTVSEDGERTYTCSRCGDTYKEPVPHTTPEGLWISGLASSAAYTGSAVIPEGVRVYHGGTLLREKTEYTISYKNNIGAGTAQVIVAGKGSYTGKAMAEFTIEAVDLSTDTNISAVVATAAETGKNLKPAVTVTWNGKKLKEKKDYTLSYNANIKAPSTEGYDVTINGTGNFKGTIVRKFRVAPKGMPLLNSAKVTGIKKSYEYDAGAQGGGQSTATGSKGLEEDLGRLVVKIGKTTLAKDTDYTVRIEKADAVGTGTVVLEPTPESAYAGEKRISFNITGTDLKKGSVTGLAKSYPYTGEPVEPQIQVYSGKNGAGAQIPADAYTVRYSGSTNPGKATVTVTGIPEKGYSGSVSASYTIGKCDISVGKTDGGITVAMPEDIKYAKGGAKPQPVITHTSGGAACTLREGVDYTLKYSNNTSVGGTKKPTLKITGTGNYCGTITETYDIVVQDLGSLTITAADRAYNSKKKGSYYYAAPKVYDLNGKQLKQNKDYTVTYTDASTGQEIGRNDDVANGAQIRVTVTAAQNSGYTGTLDTTYYVRDAGDVKDIAKTKYDKIAPIQYTGSEIRPEVRLYMQTGKTKQYLTQDDYEIIGYYNNVNKGTATGLIRGRNSCSGVKSVTFKIAAADNELIFVTTRGLL